MMAGTERKGLKEFLIQAIILIFLLVLLFPKTFLAGEIIVPGDILFVCPPWNAYAPEGWVRPQNRLMSDILTAFYPYYAVFVAAVEHGEWPLWNPFELSGMPLLANYQSATLYPARLLHIVFGLRWGTTLCILLKLWLCGFTAYLCARNVGLEKHPARFVSVGWMLASYNVIWCNWALTDVSAWVPVLFMGTEFVLDGRHRKGFFALAAGGALLLLAGHPETAYTASLGLGLYFVLRLLWERRWGRRLWLPLAVYSRAWLMALSAAAAQILPFIEYLFHSTAFANWSDDRSLTWLPFSAAAAFWSPRFFGTFAEDNFWGQFNSNIYSMIYPGLAVWAGILLLAPTRKQKLVQRARIVPLVLVVLVGMLLAFNTFLSSSVTAVPILNPRIIAYHIVFSLFALPLLGAMGIQQWFAGPRRLYPLSWALGFAALVALFLWGLLSFNSGYIRAAKLESYVHTQLLLAAAFAAASLFFLGLQCVWNKPKLWITGLTVVLAADLLLATRGLNPTMPPSLVFPRTELTEFLKNQPQPCRIGTGEGNIASGMVAVYGIEEWLGYDGIYPKRIMDFQHKLGPGAWEVMEPSCAIRYYLHDPRFEPVFPLDEPGRFEWIETCDGLEVYENMRALPRARLVGRYEVAKSADALFTRMLDPDFDPKRVVLVEKAPTTPSPEASSGNLGDALVSHRSTTRCTVEVEATAPCILVVADAYYPGWTVRIDGKPAELFPAYHAFRGVVVPEGRHTVEFSYFPWSFRIGLAVSILALAAGAFLALAALRRSRKQFTSPMNKYG